MNSIYRTMVTIASWLFVAAEMSAAQKKIPTLSTDSGASLPELQYSPTKAASFDTPPKFLYGWAPFYPITERRRRRAGSAVIAFTIGTNGRTSRFRVMSSSAPSFSEAAIDAIQRWRFQPARKRGYPVAVEFQAPFTFGP